MRFDELDVPIVLAPLAGGPATVDLAVAVSEAGGLGFLAAGYRSADDVRGQIGELRSRTERPFGVNVFAPPADLPEPVAEYAARLAAEGTVGEARRDDDDWDAKLAMLEVDPPPVVSFVFGLPAPDVIARLQGRGSEVWVTVTTPSEGQRALAAGADVLVAQGIEAGGHRGGFEHGEAFGTLALLQLLGDAPLVAAGGITSGRGIAAALAAGAGAVAIGTGFLRAAEAGTHPAHRAALASSTPTALTRAFTGKTGRGLVNDFMRRHDPHAPRAYPEVHHLTAPRRAEARAAGDPDAFNLWAGQAHALAREGTAAEIIDALMAEARAAAADVAQRLG
jgi:nitronate monooxygenase